MKMIEELEGIVGRGNVSEGREDRIVYSTDASMISGRSRLIVWPNSVSEVRGVVSWASKEGAGVTVRGAGTGLAGGCVPQESIVLDLTRLNKIISVSEAGKTARVECSVVLDDLNRKISPKLFFPVQPSSHEVSTIGGMIAADSAGLRAVKYGKTSRWVRKLEVVDGLGNVISAEGGKLSDFAGREGTTGVIVEAELALAEPLKETTLTRREADDTQEVVSLITTLSGSRDLIALEFIDRKTAGFLGASAGKHLLLAEYESDVGEIKGKEEIAAFWEMRDGVYPALASRGYAIIEDPKIPLEKMAEFLAWLEQEEIPSFGHIGEGIIHPCFPIGSEKIQKMFEKVAQLGGSVSGEHGIGLAKRKYAPRELASEVTHLKRKYDPKNILNRGVIC